MISVIIGISGLFIASFGFGASIAAYLYHAPNTAVYEWLCHWTIVFGALMYLGGFATIEPQFFSAVPSFLDGSALAFILGGFTCWGCVRLGL